MNPRRTIPARSRMTPTVTARAAVSAAYRTASPAAMAPTNAADITAMVELVVTLSGRRQDQLSPSIYCCKSDRAKPPAAQMPVSSPPRVNEKGISELVSMASRPPAANAATRDPVSLGTLIPTK
jgi:hypothetical protein